RASEAIRHQSSNSAKAQGATRSLPHRAPTRHLCPLPTATPYAFFRPTRLAIVHVHSALLPKFASNASSASNPLRHRRLRLDAIQELASNASFSRPTLPCRPTKDRRQPQPSTPIPYLASFILTREYSSNPKLHHSLHS